MISPELFDQLKKFLFHFFDLAELQGSLQVEQLSPDSLRVSIETEEAPILIGERGETLLGLQSLLRKILSKQLNQKIFIELDINDYRKKKIKYLQELATAAADEVALTQTQKPLEPMEAWERRIVHVTLSQRADVRTESQGQGPARRVVIFPLS